MPIYEYRCDQHGVFEITRPLGTAQRSATCSVCGSEARRVFSAPMIRSGSRATLLAAMDHAEKSRHEPGVVTSLPSTGKRRRTPVLPLTPALSRLPRP
ncbi:MAG: zinc ribbon domain-containing protein [Verrucomicrobia bacterium]|nr:zinc ribbon domain-containing protein [Verrucomicrobiota bacterium]